MQLRWYKENGEMILQYLVSTTLESGEVISMRWEDVSIVKEPEKTVTITEKDFWKIYNCINHESAIGLLERLGF